MTRGLGSPGLASHRCSHFGVPKRDHPRKLGRADTRVQRFDSCKYACNGYGDTCCTASSLEPVQQSAALQHSRRREKRGTSARKPIGWERLAASTTPLDAVEATHHCTLARPQLLLLLAATSARAMRLVLQRVKRASVTVDEEVVGEIGKGMLVLVGIHRDDVAEDAAWCCAVHKSNMHTIDACAAPRHRRAVHTLHAIDATPARRRPTHWSIGAQV